MLKELFALDNDKLFQQAQEIGKRKKRVECSPNIITGICLTQPVCRHCKWEDFKISRSKFGQKKSVAEVVEWARILQEEGIDRTFLASGWMGYELPEGFYPYIEAVKKETNIDVYGLFGALSYSCLKRLKEAGMDGYLCSLESPNETVYRRFRPGGDSLEDRIKALYHAKELGLKIWSGFLCGLGETTEDMISGLEILKDLEADSISILPFTPYPHTEMMGESPANPLQWARAMAVSRIYLDQADLFTDFSDGFYGEFSKLAGVNGFYVYPKKG